MPDSAIAALFDASGVIRVDTLDEMFDVGLLLAAQPLPAGDRVAVVGNSAALNTLVVAACATRTSRWCARSTSARTPAPDFGAALREAVTAENVDAVVAVFVPPLLGGSGQEYAAGTS